MKQKLHITRILLLALLALSMFALLALPALATGEDDVEYFDDQNAPVEEAPAEAAETPIDEETAPAIVYDTETLPYGDSTQAQLEPITDLAYLLNSDQAAELTLLIRQLESETGCALYIVTVDNYADYIEVGDVYDCATAIYSTYDLGCGADRDGALLLLSMSDRDYALTVHGQRANELLDPEAQIWVEDEFLPFFAEGDWYGGFRAYVEDSGYVLAGNEPLISANSTDYPDQRSGGFMSAVSSRLPFASFFSMLAAFVSTLVMKGKMKSVHKGLEARRYLDGPAELSFSEDRYTHQTESRRVVESSNNSTRGGGISHSGGGFSGRSGKF